MRLLRPFFFLILLLLNFNVDAQTRLYKKYASMAVSKYHSGQFEAAAHYYSIALRNDTTNYNQFDAYNAACSFALTGQTDSSFLLLFKIARGKKYSNYDHLIADPDLNILHADKRWSQVCTFVKRNQEERDSKLNTRLVALFDTIFTTDQQYRLQFSALQKQPLADTNELKSIEDNINRADSINLARVTSLLDQFGWLGPGTIGNRGCMAEFLVIQHGPLHIQEKYFPLLKEAAKKGSLPKKDLAILQDRMLVRRNKEQIYGSQVAFDNVDNVWFVLPLLDPENVDKRRIDVGLPPISEYVQEWNITWNVDKYKQFIKKIKQRNIN